MDITYDDLVLYCPSARQPDESVIEQMESWIMQARHHARKMLGYTFFSDVVAAEKESYAVLVPLLKRYICLKAYSLAIPSLDLVLTPTGFGVVSNQNLAPASADRVRVLRESVQNDADKALEDLLDALRDFEEWTESTQSVQYFQSLFWRSEDLRYFGRPDATRRDYIAMRPEIMGAESELIKLIGQAQFCRLINGIKQNSLTAIQDAVLLRCRLFVVAVANQTGVENERKRLLSAIEENLDSFPLYAMSSNYEANHYPRYQNKKDDTCYFF
ncbi:DUF6712 family protein [Muribaculum intestinale]|uniref:DUF6712 family protein n=1 Tax=Muribaculum intestinale TaxID=1796646 RepID=UPI0026DEFC98|nr:DUF6712 family protein [Muribaculum intestinale]